VGSQGTHTTGGKLVEYFHSVNPKCGRMAAGGNPASYMLHALATPLCDDGTTCSSADAGDVRATDGADSPLQLCRNGARQQAHGTTSDGQKASCDDDLALSGSSSAANRSYWAQAYASSAMCAQQRLKVEELLAQSQSGGEIARRSSSSKRCRPLWLQLGALVGRWWRLLCRDVSYAYSRLAVIFLVALLFSAVAGVPHDQPSVHSYSGSLVLGVLFSSSINSMLVIPLITETTLVLNKEQAAYMYHPCIYSLALNIAEFPFVVLNSLVNLCIFYPLAGLYPAAQYVLYYAVALTLFQMLFLDYGCMLAAIFKVTRRAALFCSASMSIFNFFCGFFFSESDMQYPGRLLYYISLSRLGLSTILPPNFYCSASCLLAPHTPGDAVGTGGGAQGGGCQTPGLGGEVLEHEVLEHLVGEGPGCRIIDDLSGRVLSKMGVEWAEERLGADAATLLPLRMTIWDYWSTLSDASMHWVRACGACGGALACCSAAWSWRVALCCIQICPARLRRTVGDKGCCVPAAADGADAGHGCRLARHEAHYRLLSQANFERIDEGSELDCLDCLRLNAAVSGGRQELARAVACCLLPVAGHCQQQRGSARVALSRERATTLRARGTGSVGDGVGQGSQLKFNKQTSNVTHGKQT
jgi:hypothetical protein